jgi:putative flippase GtrA
MKLKTILEIMMNFYSQLIHKFFSSPHFFADAIRFLIAGLINTGLSLVVFYYSAKFFEYSIAYSLSWIFGILFVLIFYPSKVFTGSHSNAFKVTLTLVQYIFVFICGLIFIRILVESFRLDPNVAMLLTLIFTTLVNFIIMRAIFRWRGRN